jgi:two-component system chemotaxis response regulator CheB
MKMIRVLVADDSPVMRRLLTSLIDAEPDMEVVGTASDGLVAVNMTVAMQPDVVTMDLNMPVMNGLAATSEIMARAPVPVVVVSSTVTGRDGDATLQALAEGAVAAVSKPSRPKEELRLVKTVRAMSGVRVFSSSRVRARRAEAMPDATAGRVALVVLGVSTGGPQALGVLLKGLPKLRVPMVIVQHIADGFTANLARWLDDVGSSRVMLLSDGDRLEPGSVYLAPQGSHSVVAGEGNAVIGHLDRVTGPRDQFRPSADVLFESVTQQLPGRAIGVIMTGMGIDGAQGLLKMRRMGCLTVAQSADSCVVDGMPGEARRLGAVRTSVGLADLAATLASLVGALDDSE